MCVWESIHTSNHSLSDNEINNDFIGIFIPLPQVFVHQSIEQTNNIDIRQFALSNISELIESHNLQAWTLHGPTTIINKNKKQSIAINHEYLFVSYLTCPMWFAHSIREHFNRNCAMELENWYSSLLGSITNLLSYFISCLFGCWLFIVCVYCVMGR